MQRQRLLLFFSLSLFDKHWLDGCQHSQKQNFYLMYVQSKKKRRRILCWCRFPSEKAIFLFGFPIFTWSLKFQYFFHQLFAIEETYFEKYVPDADAFGCVGDLSSVSIQFSQTNIPGSIPSPNWVFPFSVSFIANCFSALWLIVVYLAGLNVKFYDWTKLSHSLLHVRFCFYNFFVHLLQNVGTVKFYDSCPRFFYCLFVFWIESEC